MPLLLPCSMSCVTLPTCPCHSVGTGNGWQAERVHVVNNSLLCAQRRVVGCGNGGREQRGAKQTVSAL